jgi:C-terminal peptidase prc
MNYFRQYGWLFFVLSFGSSIGADEASISVVSQSTVPLSDCSRAEIRACSLICRGDINSADQLLDGLESEREDSVRQIHGIIAAYQSFQIQHEHNQSFAFQQKSSRLYEHLSRVVLDDPNAIASSLERIAETIESADPGQAQGLLADPTVARVMLMAIQHLSELDKTGHWNLAYERYGRLLAIIDGERYGQAAKELRDKLFIQQSLRWIPQEKTWAGGPVEPDMVKRAIAILDLKYVRAIDYRQLATAVLRRCRLIAEVFQHRPNADDGQTRDTQRAEWMNQINGFQFEVEGEKDGLSKEQFVTLLDQVLSANASTIRIPPAVLLAQLAQGAFDPLDPYTRIVWPGEATAFEEQISQRYTGVGVNLIKAEDGLRVVEIVPNSPAYIGGIRQDDRIVAINGASTETMTLDDAIGEITGPSGTAVKLGVKRAPSNQTEEIALERELITVMTVKGLTTDPTSAQRYWLEPREGIAYLRITQFTESTPEQMTQALEVLGLGVKGLVLDLRYNAGGSVLSAVHVADLFISKGLIARCQGRLGPSTYYCADADDALADRPMVVLINKSSASAAEIVAGALQRTQPHRAVLVGEPTYGKTCVQTITPFPGGGSCL